MGKRYLEMYEKNKPTKGQNPRLGKEPQEQRFQTREDLLKAAVAIIFVLLMVFSTFVVML
jgi:hypothetical protein